MRLMVGAIVISLSGFSLNAGTTTLTGTVRDFHQSFPDMQATICGLETGRVGSALSGGTPVFAGGGGCTSFSNASNFNQWYTDVPGTNLPGSLTITLDDTGSPGLFHYSNDSFFPIDGALFGNEGNGHNYHFTYHIQSTFGYRGGEIFAFSGDDDVWVFLNGILAVDLGGIHTTVAGSVNLDAAAGALGITPGHNYSYDLFFAERHTTLSSLSLTTSLPISPNEIPEPVTALSIGLGLVGFAAYARRRRS